MSICRFLCDEVLLQKVMLNPIGDSADSPTASAEAYMVHEVDDPTAYAELDADDSVAHV